jgi:hypothetical protein
MSANNSASVSDGAEQYSINKGLAQMFKVRYMLLLIWCGDKNLG